MTFKLRVIDRKTAQVVIEKVYGGKALRCFYERPSFFLLKELISRFSFVSSLYGMWQRLGLTKRKIAPFIQEYNVDPTEFLEPVESFRSFNDFFVRKLKKECRPVVEDPDVAIIPADARVLFFQDISQVDGFHVKGQKFSLRALFQDNSLAKMYERGSLLIARLCPFDYHRYHFPVDGVAEAPKLINGYLYSVNPIAVRKNIQIFTENKRMLTVIESEKWGKVAYIAVGATNVGSINSTYAPGKVAKGDECGYFAFGGSALVILFEPNRIEFDKDLIAATTRGMEMRCLMGDSLGRN